MSLSFQFCHTHNTSVLDLTSHDAYTTGNATTARDEQAPVDAVSVDVREVARVREIDESLASVRAYEFMGLYFDGSKLSKFKPYRDRGPLEGISKTAMTMLSHLKLGMRLICHVSDAVYNVSLSDVSGASRQDAFTTAYKSLCSLLECGQNIDTITLKTVVNYYKTYCKGLKIAQTSQSFGHVADEIMRSRHIAAQERNHELALSVQKVKSVRVFCKRKSKEIEGLVVDSERARVKRPKGTLRHTCYIYVTSVPYVSHMINCCHDYTHFVSHICYLLCLYFPL